MKYKFLPQKEPNYCVPACLQMILEKNKLKYDSQKRILEICGKNIEKPNTINNYFKSENYPLHCFDFLVNQSFFREFEELTKEALKLNCDILVGYAYESLHDTSNEANHVSILYKYNKTNKLDTTLIDPSVPIDGIVHCDFNKLQHAIFEVEDGFHIIHKNQKVLRRLSEKYL